jgi:hypothetical protein
MESGVPVSRHNQAEDGSLLPGWVRRLHSRRRWGIRLAAAQAVIILFLSALAGWFRWGAYRSHQQFAALSSEINHPSFAEADRVAEAIRSAEARLSENFSLESALPLPRFRYERLAQIQGAVPEGVTILLVEMDRTHAAVTAVSAGLAAMESYRDRLAESGLFTFARFGRVRRTENDAYQYVLSVGWDDE